jgi:hypothetical protein
MWCREYFKRLKNFTSNITILHKHKMKAKTELSIAFWVLKACISPKPFEKVWKNIGTNI